MSLAYRLSWQLDPGPRIGIVIPASSTDLPPAAAADPVTIAIIGPPGANGARYVHSQPSAALEWIVNHNLGMQPAAVSIKSIGGAEVEADIIHVSTNQLRIFFAVPFAGTAVVM